MVKLMVMLDTVVTVQPVIMVHLMVEVSSGKIGGDVGNNADAGDGKIVLDGVVGTYGEGGDEVADGEVGGNGKVDQW